jgi:hypothetical protein
VKGVILSINPHATIIDITHEVMPGSVREGAAVLRQAHGFFPAGTIHMAVVDPGVGSERRPILVTTNTQLFVGPDNGIFWPSVRSDPDAEFFHLMESGFFLPHISCTFHGRDIFAPVAARLSLGAAPGQMGPIITDPVMLELPAPRQSKDALHGEVVRVDRFGNLITNISRYDWDRLAGAEPPKIQIGDVVIEGVRGSYSAVDEGEILALFGSWDCLEISVNGGRACDRLAAGSPQRTGMPVVVTKG